VNPTMIALILAAALAAPAVVTDLVAREAAATTGILVLSDERARRG